MWHQSITVCRDVRPKPVQCGTEGVSDLWRISARPLQLSTEGKDNVKAKDHASKQSRERVQKLISIHAASS